MCTCLFTAPVQISVCSLHQCKYLSVHCTSANICLFTAPVQIFVCSLHQCKYLSVHCTSANTCLFTAPVQIILQSKNMEHSQLEKLVLTLEGSHRCVHEDYTTSCNVTPCGLVDRYQPSASIFILSLPRLRQQVHPTLWYPSTSTHDVTSKKTVL